MQHHPTALALRDRGNLGRERSSGGHRGRESRQLALDLGGLGPDGRLAVRRTRPGGIEIFEGDPGRVPEDAGIEVPP